VYEIFDQIFPSGTVFEAPDRTIIFSGGKHLEIKWESASTKQVLEEFKKATNGDKEEL